MERFIFLLNQFIVKTVIRNTIEMEQQHTLIQLSLLWWWLQGTIKSSHYSHKTLYQYVEEFEAMGVVETVVKKRWTGKLYEIDTYRFAEQLPLRDSEDALNVNWCELTGISFIILNVT